MTFVEMKYLAKIADVEPSSTRLAFRGHANSEWELHSSATRRLLQELCGKSSAHDERSLNFGKLYISYHRSVLLEAARSYGFDTSVGQRDSDLQLLSKLQHLGAATGLIDFTWDSLVALWFATESPKGDQFPGKVIVANLNDTMKFRKVAMPCKEQTLENIFTLTPELNTRQFYWEPRFQDVTNNRILRQRSIFLVGNPTGSEIPFESITLEIEIPHEDKARIRKELERFFGVSEHSLFPDVHGFARANSQSMAILGLDDPEYFENQGSELYQRGEYQRSIFAYDECIGIDCNRWMAYYLRGNAKAQIKQYLEAKADYSKALEILELLKINAADPAKENFYKDNIFMLAFNRGNANYNLKKYEEACKDYEKGIQVREENEKGTLWYNLANARAKLGHFEDALKDYDRAILSNVKYARFNKGNALVALGRYQEALQLILGEREKFKFEMANNNIANIRSVIDRIGERQSIVSIFEPNDTIVTGLPTVKIFESEEEMLKITKFEQENKEGYFQGITFICTGNSGNVGNFGGADTKGGAGSRGDDGYYIRVTW